MSWVVNCREDFLKWRTKLRWRAPFETCISSILSFVLQRHDTSILLVFIRKLKMQNRCEIEIVDFEIVHCLMSVLKNIQLVPTQTHLLSTSSKKWRFATQWKICRSKFKRCFYSEKGEKLFFNVPVCQKSILILFSSETFGKRINNT